MMEAVWFFVGWVGGTIAMYALVAIQRANKPPVETPPPCEPNYTPPRGQTMWD